MPGSHRLAGWSGRAARDARAVLAATLPAPCPFCGAPVRADQLWHVDHRVPLAHGGASTLDNLAAVTQDRFRVRRQLRVLTAQGRMTGWILVALPLVLGGILYVFNSAHVNEFLKDPLGLRMLEVSLVLEMIGAVLIHKIVSVEY